MRIAFDGTTLTPGRTGVGYYTEHLLQQLAHQVEATGDELIVLSNRPIATDRPLPPHVRVHDRHFFPVRAGWMQLMAPRALAGLRPDVAHFTNGMMPILSRVPTVVTVHDMSLRLYPGHHPLRRLLINRPLQHFAIHRAEVIVAVSHSTRRDLLRLHHVSPDRVRVVHEAASTVFRPVRDVVVLASARATFALPERYVLAVGTVEPRKNLARLVEAFAEARAAGVPHHLVCVGPYGWMSRDLAGTIERLGLASCVHFTGYVPFDLLPALYTLSEFSVFPSIYEGFGLPVVEAMACGTPVLTSNTSSTAEIAADAALTVDPLDVHALAAAIRRLVFDDELRRRLSIEGLRRAATFSWAQAAREMLAVYRRAAAGDERIETVPVPVPARPRVDAPTSTPAVQRRAAEGQDGR